MDKNVIIRPSDIGLKDLEVFYNPELLLEDLKGEGQSGGFKKTLLTTAVVAALSGPIESAKAQPAIFLNSTAQIECFVDIVTKQIEDKKEEIIVEALSVIKKEKTTFFTEEDMSEIETLDAYHSQANKYYPAKNKIPF